MLIKLMSSTRCEPSSSQHGRDVSTVVNISLIHSVIIDATGASSYHGFLPVVMRDCIQHMIGAFMLITVETIKVSENCRQMNSTIQQQVTAAFLQEISTECTVKCSVAYSTSCRFLHVCGYSE